MPWPTIRVTLAALGIALYSTPVARAEQPFKIQVIDDQTERGVPLVELQTVNNIRLWTDSQGIAAFDEPGLTGQSVFFHVRSHGYEFPQDGFGYRGTRLVVTPGGEAVLKIRRLNLAERLYRVTGAGIYRDSRLCGVPVPLRQPLLNGQVTGSDSVVQSLYRGKLYWFWGDTNRPSYPLGNFHVPGATSRLPQDGGLDPRAGVDLDYFLDEQGFAKPTAKMPGDGPTWIFGLTTLLDERGEEQLLTGFMKVKAPLTVYQRGIARFHDEAQEFRKVIDFAPDVPLYPDGQSLSLKSGAREEVYFARPFPLTRVRARAEAFVDLAQYEAYTCLRAGSRLDRPQVERNPQGEVVYSWKPDTPAVGPEEQQQLIRAKHLQPHEGLLQLRDRDTGVLIWAHAGSVSWNEFRKRFVLIAVESGGGSSFLGEVWYAEAESPVGPWVYAVKVVTHDRYSFYNPRQHALFDQDQGRTIFFEGTYTHTFSGNPDQTPRYDYNQIMYRLDLTDPRLALPVAVYRSAGEDDPALAMRPSSPAGDAADFADFSRIEFFACDRPLTGSVPIFETRTETGGTRFVREAPQERAVPVFYALPADAEQVPATTIPLWEFVNADEGRYIDSIRPEFTRPGYKRQPAPICRVWKNPYARP
ncbi:MAG: hypothetical protein ACKV0T_23435 [Planctomycetales bacterium]